MEILFSWLSPLRFIFLAIDSVAFSLLDNVYNLVVTLSTAQFLTNDTIKSLTNNIYTLISLVAFFRLALVLVNSIIDPEKLNEKGKGLSNIFFRVVGMIVILAVTPFIFEKSYELQKEIVGLKPEDPNLIFQVILGDKANIASANFDEKTTSGGEALQNIVISSLITVDENYADFEPLKCEPNADGKTCTPKGGYVFNDNCDWDNCQNAVETYNEMYVNEDMSLIKLTPYIGVSDDIHPVNKDGVPDSNQEKQEVYVYNYMLIVTTAVGIFITYIILSFAIDIAVRMFELVVLQVLSPLFIATFVDPKSSQSGPFKNWLSAVGKSYASLYIKLATLALMVLLISLINESHMFDDMNKSVSGFAKLVMVIGLLIFAKKAPKWIMDMLGIKGDGMGLWSPKKLRENMAGVGAISAAVGAGTALVGNRVANARRKHELKKGTDGYNKFGFLGKDKKAALRKGYNDKNGIQHTGRKAVSMYKKDNGLSAGQSAIRNVTGAGNAIINGVKASKDAKGIISSMKAGLGVSKDYNQKYTQMGTGMVGKAGQYIKDKKDDLLSSAYGSGSELYDRRDKLNKDKNRKQFFGTDNFNEYGELLPGGMGAFSKYITDSKGHIADDKYDAFAMCYAKIKGGTAEYDADGILKLKDSNNNAINVADAYKGFNSMLTSSGAAHFDDMYNKKQNSTLEEYNTNQRNINDAAQSLSTVNSNIENLLAGKDGISRNASTGALEITGVGGNAIKIDTRDMKDDLKGLETKNNNDLARAESDYNNGFISAKEYDERKQRGAVVDNFINNVRNDGNISTQLNLLSQSEYSLNSLMERQNTIKPTVDSIGKEWKDSNKKVVDKFTVGATADNAYITLGQKSEKLSLDADKISKTIAGIDAKPGDSKKEN